MNGMNNMHALLDTNIIIDFLCNNKAAITEITKYKKLHISIISYIEVLSGNRSHDEINRTKEFFSHLIIEDMTEEIADAAIEIRNKNKIKLPDSVILATSSVKNLILITRDEAPVFKNHPYTRYPYKI